MTELIRAIVPRDCAGHASSRPMNDQALVAWLFTSGGPIVRYRTARDLMPGCPEALRQELLAEAMATPEVRRWLDLLGQARNIHGSRDTDAENALAKLLDYGLDRSVAPFDAAVQSLLRGGLKTWDPLVLNPFLIRAGYLDHPIVRDWIEHRLEKLYDTAKSGGYDFYLGPEEAAAVPKAWRGKPIYKDSFGHESGYPLPTCYDFYAMAYCPPMQGIPNLAAKMEAIVAYLSHPSFQGTVGGYGWDRIKRRCYAAGRVFLACAEPARLVLFLELGAGFASAGSSAWFRQGLAELDGYRTSDGTYRFPPSLMAEREGPHLYGGSHMGLGENRRSPRALELESTLRMLVIKQRMGLA